MGLMGTGATPWRDDPFACLVLIFDSDPTPCIFRDDRIVKHITLARENFP